MGKRKIVLIEDEENIAELVKESLPNSLFSVVAYYNATDGVEAIKDERPDALILDWELPDMSGPDVIRILRKEKNLASLPIIMLTVRKTTSDISAALDIGADDYITKPFKTKELVSRINSVLRRSGMKPASGTEEKSDVLKRGVLQLHSAERLVSVKGKKVDLTEKEYQLLYLLIRRPGRIVSTEEIIEKIWGYEYLDGDVIGSKIRVLVQRVKTKLGSKVGDQIISKYSMGYQFKE